MKKTTKLKALALLTILTAGLVMPLTAQRTDGFFSNNDADYANRETGITSETPDGNGINNQQFGDPTAPLGSGLLIMVAAGASYAIMRRRRSRKDVLRRVPTLLLAFALLLGMTQCKKNLETITSNQGTFITLDIANDSKCHIQTTGTYETGLGKVLWDAGDWIMVLDASTGQRVGVLAYNGSVFQGYLGATGYASPNQNAKLIFVFTGNFEPEAGEIVDIWNQKDQLAVLSYGLSEEVYNGAGTYTSTLNNQCALVKFTLKGETTADVKLAGVKTRIQLTLPSLTITNASSRPLVLNNPDESSYERWAILPCGAGYTADVVIGNHLFPGAATIPALSNNDLAYVTIDNTGDYKTLPTTAFYGPNGWIEVAHSNLLYMRTGAFSEGNRGGFWLVQDKHNTFTYFQELYYHVYPTNSEASSVTLFGMGAWGYDAWLDGKVDNTSMDGNEYSWSDFNGASWSQELDKSWRTMTLAEADVIIGYESYVQSGYNRNKLYYSATVNDGASFYEGGRDIHGMIILSDSWTGWPSEVPSPKGVGMRGWDNVYLTRTKWDELESAGAIFLPCGGTRSGTTIHDEGVECFYGLYGTKGGNPAALYIDYDNTGTFGISNNYQGRLVRLVRPINVNDLPSPTSGN